MRQVIQYRRKLRQSLDAGIPGLLVYSLRQSRARQISVLGQPVVGVCDLIWIRCGRKHLRHQRIGVQRDGSDQRVELIRGQRCRRWPRGALLRGGLRRGLRRALRRVVRRLPLRLCRRLRCECGSRRWSLISRLFYWWCQHWLGLVDRPSAWWSWRHSRWRTYSLPRGVLAMNPIQARHAVAIDLSSKRNDGPGYSTKYDVMFINPPLNWAGLIRAFKVSGDPVAILCDLNVLHDRFAVLEAGGVNRPVSLHVVRRRVGQRRVAENQRYESKNSNTQRHVHLFHDILQFHRATYQLPASLADQ